MYCAIYFLIGESGLLRDGEKQKTGNRTPLLVAEKGRASGRWQIRLLAMANPVVKRFR